MSDCGCTVEQDCAEASRMFEQVKSLYEDAKCAGFQDRFFSRYLTAMNLYREHRHAALGNIIK